MLTPIDIQNKTFDVKFRGYSCDEVDDFMDMLIKDYEALYKENIALKDRISVLTDAVQQYKSMEETLQNSIILAHNASEDIRRNADAKANSIIKEAELKSEEMLRKTSQDMTNMKNEFASMKMEVESYKARMKGICKGLLEMLEKME
ncbi:MAG: DivIVA domain-containing protein [Clostridia bacterium]|nr:DivIVA domain-containing protein [Clostridia bacterium]